MLSPGQLAGPYRVLSVLGEGGMGVVYRAEHVVLGIPAVVKVLHPQWAMNEQIVLRFINEARAAAHLRHRNIVEVRDCGQLADGQWFIALEFLDGAPLSTFIASHGGPIALPIIVQILGQAANALHVAHDAGIVHRDVKPDNLFLTQTPDNDHHVTVLDFGIAKLGEETRVQTKTGLAMGTPAYMAPEQLRDAKTVDRRSDVYALGAIAWEMATGRLLWGGESNPVTIFDWQKNSPTPDPRHIVHDLPAGFANVVSRSLAFHVERRWRTTQEFLLALAHEVPTTEWIERGIDILRRYAKELTVVPSDTETVGRQVPSVGPSSTPSVPPIPASLPPQAIALSSSPSRHTQPLPHTTTLGGSIGQSVPGHPLVTSDRRRSRRAPLLAAGTLALGAAVAALAVVATRGSSDGTTTAATSPLAHTATPVDALTATSAIAIDTAPSGGSLTVDGVAKGTAPVNLLVPVGTELTVRAELAGHEPAVQTIRATSAPATVRLTLVPAPPDAGVPITTTMPAGETSQSSDPTRGGKRRDRRRGSAEAGAASAPPPPRRGFNPDDVVGD
jgi:serine/threonine protein kinase